MLSSWSKVDAFERDFGLSIGKATAVRRTGFVPVESLIYIMPKSSEGGFTVAMCLREEDLQQLKQDEEWH
jgi:hypothetical protein